MEFLVHCPLFVPCYSLLCSVQVFPAKVEHWWNHDNLSWVNTATNQLTTIAIAYHIKTNQVIIRLSQISSSQLSQKWWEHLHECPPVGKLLSLQSQLVSDGFSWWAAHWNTSKLASNWIGRGWSHTVSRTFFGSRPSVVPPGLQACRPQSEEDLQDHSMS